MVIFVIPIYVICVKKIQYEKYSDLYIVGFFLFASCTGF